MLNSSASWFFITNIAELVFCTFLYLAFFDYIKNLIPEAMILVISGLIGLIVGIMGYIAFHFDYLTIALYIGIRETPKIVGLLIAFRSL